MIVTKIILVKYEFKMLYYGLRLVTFDNLVLTFLMS